MDKAMSNPDGRFALFEHKGSSVEELERYDTAEAARDAVTELLGYDPCHYEVTDLTTREHVYEVEWPGKPKVEDPEPVIEKPVKKGTAAE